MSQQAAATSARHACACGCGCVAFVAAVCGYVKAIEEPDAVDCHDDGCSQPWQRVSSLLYHSFNCYLKCDHSLTHSQVRHVLLCQADCLPIPDEQDACVTDIGCQQLCGAVRSLEQQRVDGSSTTLAATNAPLTCKGGEMGGGAAAAWRKMCERHMRVSE